MTSHSLSGSDFHLDYLVDHVDCIPTLAKWTFDEWGHQSPRSSLGSFIEEWHSWLNKSAPPVAFVGLLHARPIGCSVIKIRELDPFPQYTFWLGGVYVQVEYRNQGIGSLIVEQSISKASELGLDQIYLYTHSHEHFYSKLGFTPVERPQFQGRTIVIMRKMLSTVPVSNE